MVERSRRSAGATIAACRTALATGCGVNLAGGTHHAHRGHGEGFCVFNDAAVATRAMQAEGAGDARADRRSRRPSGRRHGRDLRRRRQRVHALDARTQQLSRFASTRSDLDVELDDGTGDAPISPRSPWRCRMRSRGRAPDLAIYLAGADPFRRRPAGQARAVEGRTRRARRAACSTSLRDARHSGGHRDGGRLRGQRSTTSSTSISRRSLQRSHCWRDRAEAAAARHAEGVRLTGGNHAACVLDFFAPISCCL